MWVQEWVDGVEGLLITGLFMALWFNFNMNAIQGCSWGSLATWASDHHSRLIPGCNRSHPYVTRTATYKHLLLHLHIYANFSICGAFTWIWESMFKVTWDGSMFCKCFLTAVTLCLIHIHYYKYELPKNGNIIMNYVGLFQSKLC